MTTDSSLSAPAAFVRRPSPHLVEGLVTHVERSLDLDPELAHEQWEGYVGALQQAGYAIVELDPTPDLADGVFVEDSMVLVDELAVITAPGAPSRRPETTTSRAAAVAAGLRVVDLSEAPVAGDVRLDGGDVLKVGRTAYVGVGGRTTAAGAAALAHHLNAVGWQVVVVPIAKTLHLKSQVTALPDGTVVGYRPLVDDSSLWPEFLEVPEPEGAHVVVLGENTVLMADRAPRTADLYAERGLEVVTVSISEFIKLEGCVTCLSVRMHPAD
ncbi:MAG: arginine deiminase family protein [Propionibacteriales bacterium]|nr:arginine deiminase family protein [Propionibacteriales bacterium]